MSDDLSPRQQLAHFGHVLASPGWDLIDAELAERERRATEKLVRGGLTPAEFEAAAAEVRTLRAVRKFPSDRVESLRSALSPTEET